MLSRIRAHLDTLSFSELLVPLIAFIAPFEYKYRNLFRHLADSLTPAHYPRHLDPRFFFYPSDLLALALFCAFFPPLFSRQNRFLTFFFLATALSLFLSPFGSSPVVLWRLFPLLCPLLLCISLAEIASPSLVRSVFLALLAIGLFEAGIGLAQYILQRPLGLTFLMEPQNLVGSAMLFVPGGKRWLFDVGLQNVSELARATGTLPHPNVLGAFCLFAILALLPLYLETTLRKHRFALLIALSLLIAALFTTYSRCALFGLLVALIAWFAKSRPWTPKHTQLALSISLLLAIPLLLLFEQYLNRGGLFGHSPLSLSSDSLRLAMNKAALLMMRDAPFLGGGYDLFLYHLPSYLSPDYLGPRVPVHNIYLMIGAEGGLLSLSALLLFILPVVKKAFLKPLTPFDASLFAAILSLLFIGFLDLTPYYMHQERILFFLFLGLLAKRVRT